MKKKFKVNLTNLVGNIITVVRKSILFIYFFFILNNKILLFDILIVRNSLDLRLCGIGIISELYGFYSLL